MPIPDHIKKQAMDAVAHRETTEFMRQHGYSSEGPPAFFPSTPKPPGVITDAVKRRAMDAVSHHETVRQIRLVKAEGVVAPAPTPSRHATHAAQMVNDLHRKGAALEAVHQEVTRDEFGRLYE